jgi:cytochrome b561
MTRYPRALVVLHWLVAVLILAAWFTSEGGRSVRMNPPTLHFALGLSVLALVLPRLILRLALGAPPAPETTSPLMRRAAGLGHAVLYLFMIGLPLTGWYAASRLGVPVSIGGFVLPSLAAPAQGAPGWLAELHGTGGTLILILAGLYAVIAVWHHLVLNDGTLRRMGWAG